MAVLGTVTLSVAIIVAGYGIGLWFDNTSVITLMRSGDTVEIIPLVDGKSPIDCPEGYRVKAVAYYDEKVNYRCLLIQQKSDCLETESYFPKTMTCLPKANDPNRFDCGDRYFLDSFCHNRYVKNKNIEKYSNESGEFYKFKGGIITSDPTKKYDGVFLLVPIESDFVCTFKKQGHYAWCGEYFENYKELPDYIEICAEHNFNGIRVTDGFCMEILVMDYVDIFNIAYKEQKLNFIDWKKFNDIKNDEVLVN